MSNYFDPDSEYIFSGVNSGITYRQIFYKAFEYNYEKNLALDAYGNIIKLNKYNSTTKFGWKIDYIIPVIEWGQIVLENMQPLNYKKKELLGDKIYGKLCIINNNRYYIMTEKTVKNNKNNFIYFTHNLGGVDNYYFKKMNVPKCKNFHSF
jgi:hypothetical protein